MWVAVLSGRVRGGRWGWAALTLVLGAVGPVRLGQVPPAGAADRRSATPPTSRVIKRLSTTTGLNSRRDDPAGRAVMALWLASDAALRRDAAVETAAVSNRPLITRSARAAGAQRAGRVQQTPSWFRQWRLNLRDALTQRHATHELSTAPLKLLHLGTTALGLRSGRAARFDTLRCIAPSTLQLTPSVRWQGRRGDVIIGATLRCQAPSGAVQWTRLAVRTNSQGDVRWSFGLRAILPNRAAAVGLRLAALARGQRATVALPGGGWLLQLTRSAERAARQAPQRPAPRLGPDATSADARFSLTGSLTSAPRITRQPGGDRAPKRPARRRLLLALAPQGRDATLLFDGAISALPAERGAVWRSGERELPPAHTFRGVAVGGVRQSITRGGETLWLQPVGEAGDRRMGLALWRHHAKSGWQRQALPLPRTAAEGRWRCHRVDAKLRCDFLAPPMPGVRRFQSRTMAFDGHRWRAAP